MRARPILRVFANVAIAGVAVSAALLNAAMARADDNRVLVFHRTAGFVHDSIPVGVETIRDLGKENTFAVDATDDPAAFTPPNLAKYKAVVFLSTTGDVLPDSPQRAAFEGYIRGGGGYFGIHAAADMGELRTAWPWYLGLVGASFKGHSTVEPAKMMAEQPSSPMMRGWPAAETRADEWYGFNENPRRSVRVIAALDEASYTPADGRMGGDHPIAWCHPYQGGRAVYTGLGHPIDAWRDPKFRSHILGGLRIAMGTAAFACGH